MIYVNNDKSLTTSSNSIHFNDIKENKSITNNENTNFDIIKGYAANTDEGIVRKYNEDRITIILNIVKPKTCQSNEYWPKSS